MGDEDDRAAALLELRDATEALALKRFVADCEHLVEEQDVGVEKCRDREPEAHVHPGRVRSYRPVDGVLQLGERDDLVEPLPDLGSAQALHRAVEEHVLAPREVGMEAGAELEQAADAPARGHAPASRLDDPRDEPQQRRLA